MAENETKQEKETPRQHFVRLAETRVTRITEWLDKLGKLGNKNLYEYSEDDVTAIETALRAEVDKAIGRLRNSGKAQGFKLG